MGGRTMGGVRTTREVCDKIIEDLILSGFDRACEDWEVCGSYRRGKDTMSDLDIVFIPKSLEVFREWFDAIDFEKKITRAGNYYLKIRDVQVDLFIATKENYGIQKINFTGPAGFSIFLSGWACEFGYTYDKFSLKDKNGNDVAANKTEEEIFSMLELDYVEPCDRETIF